MDMYIYLFISGLFFLPWMCIYGLKKSLRKKMLKTSVIAGFAGFVAEYWYFKDYWQPSTLMGRSVISIEDFLFGFTITGIGVAVYEFAFSVKTALVYKSRKKQLGLFFLFGVFFMMVFNIVLGINSIVVSCAAFILFTAAMISIRPDLLRQSLLSGLFTLMVVVPVYALLFNIVSPHYWDDHWLLAKTGMGVTLLGNIPATELVWYFSWGCFAGTAHSFASGRARVTIPVKNNTAVQPVTALATEPGAISRPETAE